MMARGTNVLATTLAIALMFGFASPAMADNLSSSEFSALKKRFGSALKAGSTSEAASALEELAADDSWRAAQFLLKAAVQVDNQQVYSAGLRGLQQISDDEVRGKLAEKLRRAAGDWRQRVLLCDMFADQNDDLATDSLITALTDKSAEVQRAAINALNGRQETKVVDALIAALTTEEAKSNGSDLVEYQLRRALKDITGEDFRTGIDWKNFWDPRKADFDFGGGGRGGDSDEPRGEVKTHERKPTFFGSEINSNRVVFVIDVSGSMSATDPGPPDGGTTTGGGARGPQTGPGAEEEKEEKPDPRVKSRVRIDRAKGNLIGALKGLPKDARYTVIAYNGGGSIGQKFTPDQLRQFIEVWSPKLIPASSGAVGKSVQFVEKFEANGATFTMRALETAFQIPGADTIILLSDGMPTEYTNDGRQVTPDLILTRVAELNKFRKVTIHTFGFDGMPGLPGGLNPGGIGGGLADFMKKLAEQNSGKYTPIR